MAAHRVSLTSRAIALAVVLLILTISYANSLRIYFAQAGEIEATKAQIADHQRAIAELQSGLARWDDPAYVQAQARDRLGWVMPGEIGFRVVDENGKPLGGGAEIGAGGGPPPAPTAAWWTKVWGSVEAADRPAPTKAAKSAPPVTVQTKPGR